MFGGKLLLVVGAAMALWGRSLTHDDRVTMGLKSAGRVELRAAHGAVSLSASETLVKLGQDFALDWSFGKAAPGPRNHEGMQMTFSKPTQWEVRMPVWLLALAMGFLLWVRALMTREG